MGESYRVTWAPVALGDLDEILAFAESEQAGRASKLRAKFERAAGRLARFPHRGRVVPELRELGFLALRELVIDPWRLVYRVEGRDVRVVTVFDGRRDPAEMLTRRLLRAV